MFEIVFWGLHIVILVFESFLIKRDNSREKGVSLYKDRDQMDMIPELCWCTWPRSSGAGSPTCWTTLTGQYVGREGSEDFSRNQDILVTWCFRSPGSRRNSDALPLGIPLKISKVMFDLISRRPIVDYLLVKYLRLCMMNSKARTTSIEIVNFD